MAQYEDEEQVEALKKWWRENWKALAAGLVIGVGGIVGWEGWKTHQVESAAEASRLYEELGDALEADAIEQADALAGQLKLDHADSPYAAQGALAMARHLVEHGELAAADERLNWVITRSGDDGLRRIARLRRARVLWSQDKVSDALKLLQTEDVGEFRALYAELRGDIRLASGEREQALSDYREAMDNLPPGAANRSLLQRKLDDLADVAQS